MARKITLMVFTLASVLVLAGFSINQDAYAGVINGNGPSPIVDMMHHQTDLIIAYYQVL